MKELSLKWPELTWIGFDTETTGKYPLESELCEVAAVAWKQGEIVGEFQSLIKPSRPMGEEVIRIHNITNEMVERAPSVKEVLPEFLNFIDQGVLIAHHAPFDMGFLTVELEKWGHPYPRLPVVCSSRLARVMIPESVNHKLQTLVQRLKIDPGQAHRALDDAKSCLMVGLHCFEKVGAESTLDQILKAQRGPLEWLQYSIEALKEKENYSKILRAIESKSEIMVTYEGGSRPGRARGLYPLGLVRNPDGDYMLASESPGSKLKRYQLDRISKVD